MIGMSRPRLIYLLKFNQHVRSTYRCSIYLRSAVFGRCTTSISGPHHHKQVAVSYTSIREFSDKGIQKEESVFSTQRVKLVIKQYGPVAVVFHTVISLCSLGGFYLLVKSGLDVPLLLSKIGITLNQASTGLSTFGIAYLCHKVLMPLRCFITISCVPLIVRFFRRRGWMKEVTSSTSNN